MRDEEWTSFQDADRPGVYVKSRWGAGTGLLVVGLGSWGGGERRQQAGFPKA